MKKKYILLTLLISTLCTGCSTTNLISEENEQNIEQKIETIIVEQDETEIFKQVAENNVTITETIEENIESKITLENLTKDILLSMPLEDLKVFVETYLPSYRKTYHIDEDRILTDEDWESLRSLIALSLFGSTTPDSVINSSETNIEDMQKEGNMEIIKNDENSIYYAPSINDIENMTLKAFAEHLNGMYEYYRGEDERADFTQLDNESLQELKDQYIEMLKSQNSEYIEGSNIETNIEE